MKHLPLGALPTDGGVQFRVWAPQAQSVDLVLESGDDRPPMNEAGDGYFERFMPDLGAGARYRYRLDGGEAFPDPASRFQPDGVHGPSMVVDPAQYDWQDEAWTGLPQEALVFYELHVGTFSPAGTFAGAEERLSYLKDLGVTAVELMPVADFPGRWNWGYDQAALYAPSRAYGTPDDLRALVDTAHQLGLAVVLDVVYNHLGPDGAYVAAFAPMFTDKHETPWGPAINLDDTGSAGVRHLFIDNALHWLREYHIDGLRLDATFALRDDSPKHFLQELAEAVAVLSEAPGQPRRFLIAEDNRNLNTLLRSRSEGGYGLDGVWADDFHHQMRNFTAGDTSGYFADFQDTTAQEIARTLEEGWFYSGQYAEHFGKERGTDPTGLAPEQFVFCIQNHDQVGNRPTGTRLTGEVDLATYRAASALLLFAPELPLLFMGQEWAAATPFQFFTDHHEELGRLVTEGRKEEFGHFEGFSGVEVPDPQDPATFQRSKLDWDERAHPPHAGTLSLYRDLLARRAGLHGPVQAEAHGERGLVCRRGTHRLLAAFEGGLTLPFPAGAEIILHTEQPGYTEEGRPPRIEDREVHFAAPAAVLLKTRDVS